ncbi:unnamed protein product [Durusdinium trenchii]|uniref:Uncharacterized protein n=1 Tax=Durusdinium trenchii TaxID=1381693 RepID=A0ABP0P733_9DINO
MSRRGFGLLPVLAALLVAGDDNKVDGPVVGVYKNGVVEIVPSDQGNRMMPSTVAFDDEETLVGEAAKSLGQVGANTASRIFDVKRLMGRRFEDSAVQRDLKTWPFKVVADSEGNAAISINRSGKAKVLKPEDISSLILQKLKARASDYLGREVLHAVVTVPAVFDHAMRQAVKTAGSLAGLEVLRIINEPTAAAVAYGLEKRGTEEILLVYDLGGGKDADLTALERLRVEVEKAKRKLRFFDGTDLSETLTRAQFEKLNHELFMRTLEPVRAVLKDAGLEKTDVNTVILAGGSARIPKVQQILSQFFDGKELTRSINPDEVVAYGAAIQAASLSTEGDEQEVPLIDVTPLSLGIQTAGGFMTSVLKRNTPLPAENTMVFSTHKDNQEMATVKVFQGERLMAKNNRLLGSFQIKGIPPAPRGVPQIHVSFKVDVNGLLSVEARDTSSGQSGELKVEDQAIYCNDVSLFPIVTLQPIRREDQQDLARAEAKLALKLLIRSLHLAAEMALEEDASTFLAAASDAQDWLAANPDAAAEEIHEKREELEGNVPEMPSQNAPQSAELDMEGHDEL